MKEYKKILVRLLEKLSVKISILLGKGWVTDLSDEVGFLQKAIEKEKDKVRFCIDIGGNQGDYTSEMLKFFPNAKVLTFEPSSINIEKLNSRFKNNKNVSIAPYAVAEQAMEATLYSDEIGSGMGSLTKRRLDHFNINFESSETVSTIRFEEYWKTELGERHIDICKLDIEGHELDALKGFGDALTHVDVLQFEFGGTQIDSRTFFQDFWYLLNSYNFEIFRMSPLGLIKIEQYREFDEFFAYTNFVAKKRNL